MTFQKRCTLYWFNRSMILFVHRETLRCVFLNAVYFSTPYLCVYAQHQNTPPPYSLMQSDELLIDVRMDVCMYLLLLLRQNDYYNCYNCYYYSSYNDGGCYCYYYYYSYFLSFMKIPRLTCSPSPF